MVQEGVEAEAKRRQLREALAQLPVEQQALRPHGRGAPLGLLRIAGRDEADAAEAAAAGRDHRFEDLRDARAQRKVGMADNTGTDTRLAVAAAGTHRRDAIGELDLAD